MGNFCFVNSMITTMSLIKIIKIILIVIIIISMMMIIILGETFLQVTRLLQGYIENEVKIDNF